MVVASILAPNTSYFDAIAPCAAQAYRGCSAG